MTSTDAIRPLIEAVLYEGYVLYPYRASATKNRHRWTFGELHPAGGNGSSKLAAQCLAECNDDAELVIEAGFLHAIERSVETRADDGAFHPVESIDVGGRRLIAWREATERRSSTGPLSIASLLAAPVRTPFAFDAESAVEDLPDETGRVVARIRRERGAITGDIHVTAVRERGNLVRVTIAIENSSATSGMDAMDPIDATSATSATSDPATVADDAALERTLGAAHALLSIRGGAFVSLIDPPDELAAAAADCRHEGCFPVLIGEAGTRDRMLVSPIILYDHPQLAPESPGTFFDGTEMDEMLALRILTLTDDEKRDMAALDPRADALLGRVDGLGDALGRLHGTWRDPPTSADNPLRPSADSPVRPSADSPVHPSAAGPKLAVLRAGGREIRIRDRVRLRPSPRGDVLDLALDGRVATIEAIERDFDDRIHVAVTIDDDPGRDLGAMRMPGHRFFFSPDEIEPIGSAA